jgi:ethanolamine ammonia-lyase small subunit
MSKNVIHQNSWGELRQFTAARIALGRTGNSLPTKELLKFGLAHAQARDAVHLPFCAESLATDLEAQGFTTLHAYSAAPDRETYLRRPDLGRQLALESLQCLQQQTTSTTITAPVELVIVVGDGLSSTAIHRNTVPFLLELRPRLEALGINIGPVVLTKQARVAIGDDVAEALNAKAVVVLIGERPGLSSPDSLGVYLTWAPKVGLLDSERNCISNVRPEGLNYPEAAHKLSWLLAEAFQRKLSGVALKDESDNAEDILLTSKTSTTLDNIIVID